MAANRSPQAQALQELEQAPDEARADGLPPPSAAAMDAAHHLLPRLHQAVLREYAVYPGRDGEVCIDARDRQKKHSGDLAPARRQHPLHRRHQLPAKPGGLPQRRRIARRIHDQHPAGIGN